MNKKRIIIFAAGFLVLMSISFFFLTRKQAPPPTPLIVPPDIPKYIEYGGPIEVDFPRSQFKFPETLPFIKTSRVESVSEIQAVEYAKGLGFDTNYISFDDSRYGKIFLWNQNGKTLTVYSRSGSVVFNPDFSSQTTTLNPDQGLIKETAKKFLVENNLVEESLLGISILYSLDSDNEHSHITTFENAVVHKIVFSPNLAGYEIVTSNPTDSVISVWMDKNNRVIKVEISKLGSVEESLEKYSVKTYDDFVASINESSVVDIDDGNILPQDIDPEEISNIKVNGARIAYLRSSYTEEFLKPIFVIQAEITINGEGSNAILYLPALK